MGFKLTTPFWYIAVSLLVSGVVLPITAGSIVGNLARWLELGHTAPNLVLVILVAGVAGLAVSVFSNRLLGKWSHDLF